MTRALASLFVVFFSLAPVVNDLCGLTCVRAAASECPLHSKNPAPEPCKHDHALLRADVARAHPIVPTLNALGAVTSLVPPATVAFEGASIACNTAHTPPIGVSRSTVLRI